VRHEELEKHDGVPSGKYTVGLDQQGLAFVGDREDAVSMGLTALRRLLDKHAVSPLEVGFRWGWWCGGSVTPCCCCCRGDGAVRRMQCSSSSAVAPA
jgi:hypothetical protein